MNPRSLCLPLLLVLGLNACDTVQPAPSPTFEATLQGALSKTLTGDATVDDDEIVVQGFSETTRPSGQTYTVIKLRAVSRANPEVTQLIQLTFKGPVEVLEPKRYDVTLFADETFSASYLDQGAARTQNYLMTSGSVTITGITDRRISGHFEMRAENQYWDYTRAEIQAFTRGERPFPAPLTLEVPLRLSGSFEAEQR